MTDRYNALTVVLDHDYRDDDARVIIAAIMQLRGVRSVNPEVANIGDHIARMRVRDELGTKLMDVLRSEPTQ